MSIVRFERVDTLPANPVANTQYFVKPNANSNSKLYVTGSDGVPTLVSDGIADALSKVTLRSITPTGDTTDRKSDFEIAGVLGSFTLSSGSYTLSTQPSVSGSTIIGFGAKLSGPAYPTAADVSILNTAGIWSLMATASGTQKFTGSDQLVLLPSGSHGRSYEAAARHGALLTYDNSVYSFDGDGAKPGVGTSLRDGVALDCKVINPAGLSLTRLRSWGFNVYMATGSGPSDNGTVDGNLTGGEIRHDNFGGEQPFFQTSTTKNGLQIYAGGNKRLTSATHVGLADATAGQGFYHGHTVDGAAITGFAYAVFKIDGITPQRVLGGIRPDGSVQSSAGFDAPIAAASAVTNPAAGFARIFFDSSNSNKLSAKNSSGTVAVLSSIGV